MTIDTSKETGYVVQSSVAADELIVTKETGYVVQSSLPEGVMVMKETAYVVLKLAPVFTSVGLIRLGGHVELIGKIRFKS